MDMMSGACRQRTVGPENSRGRANWRWLAPIFACIFSCNDHVTLSCSCWVLEVLQHHLRPLNCCKAMKGGAFHGGNTGSNPVGDAKSFQ